MGNRLAAKLIECGQSKGHVYQGLMGISLLPFRETFQMQDDEATRNIVISIEYYKKLHHFLHIGRVNGIPFTRVGGDKDGGYIMLDDFGKGSIAYSFGIGPDVTWDDAMADKGYDIYMYDHTIKDLPKNRKNFHFFREGITGDDITDAKLHSMKHFMTVNQHTNCRNMILKMDIEGAEWEVLDTVESEVMEQFDQLVFEFHGMISAQYAQKILPALERLNKTHICIHLHPNNYGRAIIINGKMFPSCIEVLYVNRKCYGEKILQEADVCLPLPLDAPDAPQLPEFNLGYWNRPLQEKGAFVVMDKLYI